MRWSAAGLACFVALTACAGHVTSPSATSSRPPATGSTPRSLDEQQKVNRKQAEDEVARLILLAQAPPGAVALDSAPAALSEPSAGTPSTSSYVALARFWRVPMPVAALEDYVRGHPPAGLTQVQDGSESQRGTVVVRFYGWRDVQRPGSSPSGGQLSIGVAGSGNVSYLRADAGSEWLDPHPIPDDTSGARLRLEAGQSCPAGRGFADVRNDGADDLDRALAPQDAPASGRLCVYPGSDGGASGLLRQRALSRAEAARLAAAAHSVELGHLDNAVTNCPAFPGLTIVLVLTYPSRPAVDLLIRTGGCSTASNGHVVASGSTSLAALEDLLNQPVG
jgi:hypothetical protein